MTKTIQFYMSDGRKWAVTRVFNDDKHVDNFIDYIMRTKGWNLDEVFNS